MAKSFHPDSSNWREDYKQFTSDKRDLVLLENGPKSVTFILIARMASTQTVLREVRAPL